MFHLSTVLGHTLVILQLPGIVEQGFGHFHFLTFGGSVFGNDGYVYLVGAQKCASAVGRDGKILQKQTVAGIAGYLHLGPGGDRDLDGIILIELRCHFGGCRHGECLFAEPGLACRHHNVHEQYNQYH